jgi:NADH:ubiquinone oxidoreductase subunit E
VIPIAAAPAGPGRERRRQAPKGRIVDARVLADVRSLVGEGPLRRDLLIEYLHRLNDAHGQLGMPHLAALAQVLGLAQTEVYEVASFYHHFDIVREGPDGAVPAAPALTVRVCDGLSCELAGARALLQALPQRPRSPCTSVRCRGRRPRPWPQPRRRRCATARVSTLRRRLPWTTTPTAPRAAMPCWRTVWPGGAAPTR